MPIKTVRILLPICLLFFYISNASAQISNRENSLLLQLDSVAQQKNTASHFAKLYAETFVKTIAYFKNDDRKTIELAGKFEVSLASFFFTAIALKDKNTGCWQTYFSDTTLTAFQYQLLGINAHVNSDIWQALTTAFSLSELQAFKPIYLSFLRKGMVQQYKDFYSFAAKQNGKARLLHWATLGLSKSYGRQMLIGWGRRQIKLAFWYYKDKFVLTQKIKNLTRKTMRRNQLILRNF